MIKIFGFNITTEDQAIADKVMAMLPGEAECIDLRCYEPESTSVDVVLIFGEKACNMCKDLPYKIKEVFPDFAKLSSDFGEQHEVEQARAKFKLLKQRLVAPDEVVPIQNNTVEQGRSTVTEESMPDMSAAQILEKFKTILTERGQKEWLLYAKNNKVIRITIEPEQSNADIDMTFAELYTLKMAMETLQAKEVEIVYRSKSNKRNNPP